MIINVSKRQVGVNFSPSGEAEIILWSPLARQAHLVTADAKIPLNKEDLGYWKLHTRAIRPGDIYGFSVNAARQLPDPASLSQPSGVHNLSSAVDLRDMAWTDDTWQNIALENYILYELHTGAFTPEGTFRAIEERLDYLLKLGINAIEIMPVGQFSGTRNWGYDGVFPFSVQDNYGGAKALQDLVNSCHQRNIAVVLDVVYNHIGPEGNYFEQFGPYFTGKYHTPWGNAINFDDAWNEGARTYFIENALMWFRDFHIDALRLDAVHAIKDFSAVHILREIKDYTDQLMAETGRTHYLIAESDLNDNRYINPISQCGYGMDAQWIDEFHHALRVSAGQEKSGYYSDFNGISHLAKSYNDAYVYDGQFSEHRKKMFGAKAAHNPGSQFVVFSQNHDQVGNRMLGERISRLVGFEMLKVMAAAVMTSPFLPMLFMGEEYGETNPFLYFVSHSDPQLAEAVKNGRKAEFEAFHAEGEAPDPNAEETFKRSGLQWELLNDEPHRTLFAYYQKLIFIRKTEPALHILDRNNTSATANTQNQVVTLCRSHHQQEVICLMNFSGEQQEVNLPAGKQWSLLLDSASPEWNGPVAAPETADGTIAIEIQASSALIYQTKA